MNLCPNTFRLRAALVALILPFVVAASSERARGMSGPAPARTQNPSSEAAQRQHERELLDQAFHSLEEELKAAIQDYQVVLKEASTKGLPRDQWPKGPAPDYYARFEELALKDQPDALRWCIGIVSSIGFPMDEANARKLVLYEHMVKAHAASPWIADIVSFLSSEGSPTGIGVDRAAPFLDAIAKAATTPEVRAKALWTRGTLYAGSAKPEHAPLALKTWRELVATCPGTNEAKRAAGLVFQADHLQVGMSAPEVTTANPDGAQFKLSDYRGKVVVISFWGFWCAPCRALLPHEKAMVERLKDKPFALIGVDTDGNKDEFKRLMHDNGFNWKTSWQGSRQGPWPDAWGITYYPSIFVLDEKGVIRFASTHGHPPTNEELDKIVDDLLAELQSKSGTPSPK